MVKYSYVDFLERLLKITMTIGEKIKFLRLSKKLTQSAICGDLITRNMLSRIENGAALPSLPTLKQLADALGVSAGYFLDAGDDPFPYQKLALMPPIKEAFKKGDYTSALALSASLDKDDEIAYIEAALLNWQVDSLPLSHLGSPYDPTSMIFTTYRDSS